MATTVDFMEKDLDIKTYRKMKIKMLQEDFYINLTDEEKKRLNALKTEIAIDQYCRTLIKKALK